VVDSNQNIFYSNPSKNNNIQNQNYNKQKIRENKGVKDNINTENSSKSFLIQNNNNISNNNITCKNTIKEPYSQNIRCLTPIPKKKIKNKKGNSCYNGIKLLEKINIRNQNYIGLDIKNENLEIIQKNGELKGLSKEEILRNKKFAQVIEDMSTMGRIMKNKILKEKKNKS